tara:strand:+ start:1206 stop:1838 length:633 start_codon:yes stop_codon:yes gene_type:complete
MKIIFFIGLLFLFSLLFLYSEKEIINENKYSIIKRIPNNPNLVKKILKKNNNSLRKPIPIKEMVKINNKSNLSPTIISYTENFIIMGRMDYTLKEMFIYLKLDQHKLKKLINLFRNLDNYDYSHNDLHWKNIMWSNKLDDFRVIDWEFATLRKDKVDYIEDDMDYLYYKLEEIAFNLGPEKIEIAFNVLKSIYKNKSYNYFKALLSFYRY